MGNWSRTFLGWHLPSRMQIGSIIQPTLWRAIPAIEEFQTTWEMKCDLLKYEIYKDAIQAGLDKIRKYYQKFDDKPVYVLTLILHPYYKLAYIKLQWGGPEDKRMSMLLEIQTLLIASLSSSTVGIESEYDRHHHELVEKATLQYHSGWRAKLCHYLTDMPDNVSKNMDIIEWWLLQILKFLW
ncbi:hypothetical protein BDR07DRAFT_1382005 [Suillus spraguei]|nr:hypothetical protein BDR07DRAFT_1382005 [Suillus spraguei]